jgi:hypothetical protein
MSSILKGFARQNAAPERPAPAARRISTPAGQRLSTIMENGSSGAALNRVKQNNFEDHGSGTSTEVWSEGEKLKILRTNRHITKRGGWKRLGLIILALIIAIVIAVAVGVTVSQKKKQNHTTYVYTRAFLIIYYLLHPNRINWVQQFSSTTTV